MTRQIGIIDTTLRDAQQCLWTTRMTAGMMDPVAETMDRAGFDMIDFMAPVQFDVCVRYLREDPFEKARHFRKKFERTPLRGYCRSKSLTGFGLAPDDMVELWIERLAASGFRVVGTLDSLLDVDNMAVSIRHAKKVGIQSVGALVFCESPLHTDELYARTARELVERCGVDGIMIKDSGALLTPDRIRTLVPALKAVIGKVPLELHSHCNTGLAPLVYLEAVRLGVDQLHTSIAPLASGPAQPATQGTLRNLELSGFWTRLEAGCIDEVSEYLEVLADREGFPRGAPMEYDAFHYKHQMPGGMMANWRFQLQQSGLESRFEEILEEIARVREDLAWPIMVTPFSQIIAVQAMLNVVNGERYRVVPDEVKMYALGHFGKLLGPVNPQALDRIVSHGSKRIPLKPQPMEPALAGLRKAYPNMSDDERLLRYMFPADDVDKTYAAKPLKLTLPAGGPVPRLIEELAKRPVLAHFELERNGARIAVTRHAPARQIV
ncbi:MAG TPA: carboxylase [Polaromonas sp.]|jgi:oxaloacetate decarboxylase alpha subunit|uniref:carboxylase n=1 Tax=unclassified Polaromonas TaxID=2638319 RepID=UPI000BC9D563|nr:MULTISPECIES: carboxylase [unclassified Polaromonas]OYY39321.1 MAG: carboxylase [Polaromonas sp. 35-63-35]OYZ20420.1 MAG: carboxylase [Polaromonas sp. 16-63-31]OYZ80626.1 MAG: carboxylase [Polaromonas sp. 24-63-21]OZA51688.1 MAG: carboxylase [Polaromonas sp. 17-63-33]OZA89841.1 MAG: carboxylase [Polaromonas sp. 39-63-25]